MGKGLVLVLFVDSVLPTNIEVVSIQLSSYQSLHSLWMLCEPRRQDVSKPWSVVLTLQKHSLVFVLCSTVPHNLLHCARSAGEMRPDLMHSDVVM